MIYTGRRVIMRIYRGIVIFLLKPINLKENIKDRLYLKGNIFLITLQLRACVCSKLLLVMVKPKNRFQSIEWYKTC